MTEDTTIKEGTSESSHDVARHFWVGSDTADGIVTLHWSLSPGDTFTTVGVRLTKGQAAELGRVLSYHANRLEAAQ